MLRGLLRAWGLKRFARERSGAAALEFSIVVIPFFLLTFGLAEVSMLGFAQTSLDYATSETARQIRTGQAQINGVSAGQIRARLCTELNRFMVVSCDGNLFLDVRRFDSFVDVTNENNAIQDGVFDASGMTYAPGAPSDIVVVRAYYRWQIITPVFERVFANVAGGERILVSTMMFRNEPYQ